VIVCVPTVDDVGNILTMDALVAPIVIGSMLVPPVKYNAVNVLIPDAL
jgi:hypothetical protein